MNTNTPHDQLFGYHEQLSPSPRISPPRHLARAVYTRKTKLPKSRDMAKPPEEHRGRPAANKRKKFFHCYLLQSQDPKHKRSTYIGFTVDPGRRIRQHK